MSDRQDFMESMGVKLKPLKAIKKLRSRSFFTFDCETKDGLKRTQLFCWALAYRTKERKTETIHGFTNLKPLFDFLHASKHDKSRYKIIFSHNLAFDSGFLNLYCQQHNIECKVIKSGSNVIVFSIPEIKLRFVDSLQFLQESQEKAEYNWKVDLKITKEETSELMKELFQNEKWNDETNEKVKPYPIWTKFEKKQLLSHCKNDVCALWSIMNEYRKTIFEIAGLDVLVSQSIASMAMKAFRICMNDSDEREICNPFITLDFKKEGQRSHYMLRDIDASNEEFCRRSFFGGRTEVYDNRIHKNAHYVDKVGMYQYVMKEKKYPKGWGYWSNDIDLLTEMIQGLHENMAGFIECYIEIPESEKYPILPQRLDERVMFTNCTRIGVHTLPELQYAQRRGYKIEPISGFIFDEVADYFSGFITKFAKIKDESKGGKRTGAKLIQNGVYGKFGQAFHRKNLKPFYFTNENDMFDKIDELELEFAEKGLEFKYHASTSLDSKLFILMISQDSLALKPFMNVCIASYITAYARIEITEMLNQMQTLKIPVFYSDTDSLTIPNKNISKLTLGKTLGCWDIEQSFVSVKFVAPKCYFFLKHEIGWDKFGYFVETIKPFLKMKGIEKRKIEEIIAPLKDSDGFVIREKTLEEIEELIREPIQLAERYLCYTEAHRDGTILGTKKLCKHYSLENLKREFKNGQSMAWNDETIPEKYKQFLIDSLSC